MTETSRSESPLPQCGYSGYVADPDGHPWELAYDPSTRRRQIGPDGVLRLVDP
ncbi:MAG: hypothetical protein ACRDQD_22995 [Nocardioidaceae bacterium]